MDVKKLRLTSTIKLFFLIFMIVDLIDIEATTSTSSYHYPVVTNNQMIKSLEGIIQYYENNYQHIILDGYFGFTGSKGFIRATIKNYHDGLSTLNTQQINRVQQIYQRIIAVSKRIEPILANNSMAYNTIGKIVQGSLPVPKRLVKLNFTKLYNVSSDEILSPKSGYMNISDWCIGNIIGSKALHVAPCTISDTCWTGITNYHGGYYGITHQLITILNGQRLNCTEKMNKLAKNLGGIQKVKEVLCTQIYYQMQKELKKGLKNIQMQDLFLEQIFVCGGWIGYQQFLKAQYLSMMLKWQTKAGCFIPYYGPFISLHPKFNKNYTRDSSQYSSATDELRTNLITPDGCYEHRTSVALIDVSIYLYWNSHKKQSLHLSTMTTLTSTDTSSRRLFLAFTVFGIIAIGLAVIMVFVIILTMYYICPFRGKAYPYHKLNYEE